MFDHIQEEHLKQWASQGTVEAYRRMSEIFEYRFDRYVERYSLAVYIQETTTGKHTGRPEFLVHDGID